MRKSCRNPTQKSPPPRQHDWTKVSKAPTLRRVKVAKIIPFRLCCTEQECNVCTTHLLFSHLSRTRKVHSHVFWIFSKMADLFPTSFPGLFLHYLGRGSPGNKVYCHHPPRGRHGNVKFPTLGICRMIKTMKIPTLRTDLTDKATWVPRPPPPPGA